MTKDEPPILLEDADASPATLAYATPAHGRRRHSQFAVASCALYGVTFLVDRVARQRMHWISDGLIFGWEGQREHFRANYPVVPLMLIAGAGLACALVALITPHTKKWLAVVPLPLHAWFLFYLWLLY